MDTVVDTTNEAVPAATEEMPVPASIVATADEIEDAAPAAAPEESESVPVAIRSFPDARPCNLLVHEGDHKMYVPVFPRSLSLECAEGDEKAESIEFTHDTAINVAGIERLEHSGDFLQTPPIPLYHSHVLWSYTLRLTRVKEQKCALSLVSIGPHLGLDNSEKKGSIGRNEPPGLRMPRVLGASLVIIGTGEDKEKERLDLSTDRGGSLSAGRNFDAEELIALADGGVLRVRVRLVVGRAYFALSKLVDLRPSSTITPTAQRTLDSIINGERPGAYDWAITVAESDEPGPTLYYTHRAAFGHVSDAFKVAFQTGHSYEDQIMMVTGENRCIVTAFTAEDMKVVIPLVYSFYAPLPERWQRVSALGRTLCRLFKPDLITGMVFPQWDRAICKAALELDKSSFDSFTECFRLLTIIWSCPYGSMPTAKRVTVGVLADMMHLNADDANPIQHFTEKVLPSLGDLGKTVHVAPIINSATNHLTMVSSVRKTGLAPKNIEWK